MGLYSNLKYGMSHGLTLKQADALLEALEATALVSMTNKKGDIVYVNQKFIEVSGYSKQELLGQNHRLLKSGQQPDELFKNLWKTISEGKVWRGEIKNRAKDGSYYWVDTSIAPILNLRGNPYQYISVRFLITEQVQLREKIEHLSHSDPLTGIANRRLLDTRLQKALQGRRSTDDLLGVLAIDLDYFKVVNDRYGHEMGDKLLQRVAVRLRSCIREVDTLSRVGGDEFVILANNLHTEKDATILATKILEKVSKPYRINSQIFKIGASIGVALAPLKGGSSKMLLRKADQALYQAKEAGRNRFVLSLE